MVNFLLSALKLNIRSLKQSLCVLSGFASYRSLTGNSKLKTSAFNFSFFVSEPMDVNSSKIM